MCKYKQCPSKENNQSVTVIHLLIQTIILEEVLITHNIPHVSKSDIALTQFTLFLDHHFVESYPLG